MHANFAPPVSGTRAIATTLMLAESSHVERRFPSLVSIPSVSCYAVNRPVELGQPTAKGLAGENGTGILLFVQQNVEQHSKPPFISTGETEGVEHHSFGNDELWVSADFAFLSSKTSVSDSDLANLGTFIYCQFELKRLETAITDSWDTLSGDVHFTHQANPEDVKRWSHVMERTEWATSQRISLARLTPPLERLIETAQWKSIRRLAEQLRCEARLEAVSDQLEVFEDTYELANDRISEFSYFRREWLLEVWIIVLLLLEVGYMAAEIYFQIVKQ